MDNITASRVFEAYNAGKVKIGIVQVLISVPVEDTNAGGDWNCNHQVLGCNDDTIKNAYGVDSLQALLLCIKKIEAELQYFQKANNLELRWTGLKGLGLATELFK